MAASWPFSMWGMDVIGPINPKASNGHLLILVAIDYFTKWIEAITLASVTAKTHRNSSPYRPQMNGVVEATNKNIKKIIKKMTMNYKDWHKMLPFALLAYRTSICLSTGATLYSLVYSMEAVLPVEVEIPSMRVLAESKLHEWAKQCYEQLNLIDEKQLTALCHGQCYQQRMA
ncbi:hypothetical protein CRG98_028514 [Punica granatum]|uniref:Integrase catalytic domain-containing protein n=1 Tax=Punica granatum TaxID=22663 RepID=A0A2I0J4D7_PUNGR|nr:hypothetical protein CRG98_028514 [Punica granatum]